MWQGWGRMPNGIKVHAEDIEKFAESHDRSLTRKLMNRLAAHTQFYQAVSTDLGQTLIDDMMDRLDALLPKIVELTASDEEKIAYKELKRLLDDWVRKIRIYEETALKIIQNQ